MKISDYVIKFISELGVDKVFCVTGGGAMHLNNSLGCSEDVEGVFRCRIVEHNITQSTYSEVTDNNYNVSCFDNEYYSVDMTDIEDRITEASFSIDLSISS